ncbi:MAG: IS3 family transposase [Culicoidibacterales bacterium]
MKKLGVSTSGYYDWKERVPSQQEERKIELTKQITKIHENSHEIYGAPKIAKLLNEQGVVVSKRTVGQYMKEVGLKAHYIKPYTITTKDSNFSARFENLLNRDFNPEAPNAAWCTDITYIWTEKGFVYLMCVMDFYSRKVIAWDIGPDMNVDWCIKIIEKAKKRRQLDNPIILQVDRGVQYTSKRFIEANKNDIIMSYSKKATPWDNAVIESFHALIKREWLGRHTIKDIHHAYQLVFEYIETFYNTVRIHEFLNYQSPDQFEQQFNNRIQMKLN